MNPQLIRQQTSGFTLVELIVVITVIGIIVAIAVPNLLIVRRASQESSGLAMMRSIVNAEGMYFSSYGNNVSYGTLDELVARECIDASLLTQSRNYYRFQITLLTPISYTATGTPDAGYASEMRHFFTDETGIIREAKGTAANASSPPVNK